jgi:hypothetical protein
MIDSPSINVTGPVGVPTAGDTGLTVAVNVTGAPNTLGFGDDVNAVVVFPWLTTCGVPVSEPEAVVKLVSPPYEAVMVWPPTESDELENVATPLVSVPAPMEVPPSKKVTVPVGVPPAPDTVAVNVTDCPKTDGFCDEVSVTDVVTRV